MLLPYVFPSSLKINKHTLGWGCKQTTNRRDENSKLVPYATTLYVFLPSTLSTSSAVAVWNWQRWECWHHGNGQGLQTRVWFAVDCLLQWWGKGRLCRLDLNVCLLWSLYITGANTRPGVGWIRPALHLVLSHPAPCFCLAAVPSSRWTVKEQLHVHSPNITFGPLKAMARLMWPLVKMSLTPLLYIVNSTKHPGKTVPISEHCY